MTKEEQIFRLEHCMRQLQEIIQVLKGEAVDRSGLGLQQIFWNNLEVAMNCKIIPNTENTK